MAKSGKVEGQAPLLWEPEVVAGECSERDG